MNKTCQIWKRLEGGALRVLLSTDLLKHFGDSRLYYQIILEYQYFLSKYFPMKSSNIGRELTAQDAFLCGMQVTTESYFSPQ